MALARWLSVFGRSLASAFDDHCFETAKSAAFSSLFCFFPGLMVVAGIFFHQRAGMVVAQISTALGTVLPPQAYRLARQYLDPEGAGAVGLLIGAGLAALWSAAGVILSLTQGFRAAYRIPNQRSILRARLVALALVLLAGLPLLAATLLVFFGHQIEGLLVGLWGEGRRWILPGGRAARWLIALATSVAVISTVYHFATERRPSWRYVWPGAVVATALWLGATVLFTWYAQNVARYRDLYGSIAAVVVLMVWMYIACLVVLIGCEFNAEYERCGE